MTGHDLVEVIDLGWQWTGWESPRAYRVDGRCSCGHVASTSTAAGEQAARVGIEGLYRRHARLADLEDRIVARFMGQPLGPASTLILTEQAARRFAALAIEELHRPTPPRR